MRRIASLTIAALLIGVTAHADVRAEEKSQVKFEGMLGRMLNLFGGRGAKDGLTTTIAVKGDRKATMSETTGQIIDLKEEKIYELDLKGKSYKVVTFDELRRQMEEARKKAEAQAARETPAPASDRQVDVDFDLKETGQKRAVNGFDAREVVMTITVREKGKTLEQNGGMVLTNDLWLAPTIAGMKDIADFDRRYAEKLFGPSMIDAQQFAAALAMYPMMKEAMARLQKESVNMSGTPVATVTRFETVAGAEAAAAAPPQSAKREEPKATGGLSGLGGRLARRAIDRGKDKDADAQNTKDASSPSAPNRATVMTMQTDVLKVTPAASDADVAIPAGFKQR